MRRNKMPCFLNLLLSITVFCCTIKAQTITTENSDAYHQLIRLLDEKNFFGLAKQLHKLKERLTRTQRLYFQVHVDNAFNHLLSYFHNRCILCTQKSYSLDSSRNVFPVNRVMQENLDV